MMTKGPETLTATVEGQFGEDRKITLVRQPDGQYKEVADTPEAFTATVEGRFGEERKVTLVRRPDGHYEEVVDASARAGP